MKLPPPPALASSDAFLPNHGGEFCVEASGSSLAALPLGLHLATGMRVNCAVPKLLIAFRKRNFISSTNLSAVATSSRILWRCGERNPHDVVARAGPNHSRQDVSSSEKVFREAEREEQGYNGVSSELDSVLLDEKFSKSVEEESSWEVKANTRGELKPGLYLVGTPIGNMEDITLRALRVLKSAACILAEDTRHSAKLLQHYQVRTPMLSYHKFNERARIQELIGKLSQGEALALISDAGMPGISDPGSEMVKACIDANVEVFPIPGPSAFVTALVASGLSTKEFSFVGFLPERPGPRKKRLLDAAKESATQIFFIPPHKFCKVLEDMISAFGPMRRCAVAREMTKLHEEFWRGTLDEAKELFNVRKPRGELTLVVEGVQYNHGAEQATEEELRHRLQDLLDAGESPSEATRQVVQEGYAKRNMVYSLALEISKRPK